MNENRHYFLAKPSPLAILQCARHAADDRRYALQVGWIVREQKIDAAVDGLPSRRIPEMVL